MKGPYYPQGLYVVGVTEQAWGKSTGGFDQFVLKFDVLSRVVASRGADGEVTESFEAVDKVYNRTSWTIVKDDDQSLDFFLMKTRAAGFEGSDFKELNLVDSEIRLECEHNSYNGKVNERWNMPLPNRSSAPLENDASIARRLNSLLNKKLKASGNGATKAPAPQAPPSGGNPLDDDSIPF